MKGKFNEFDESGSNHQNKTYQYKALPCVFSYFILGEPHHVRSTVKSVFLLACMLSKSIMWLKCKPNYIKHVISILELTTNHYSKNGG